MFGKSELTFKAQIRKGARISQDHRYGMKWPECLPPGGGDEAKDPDMEFEASLHDNFIELRAPGYGVLNKTPSQYGNGTIHASNIADLIVSDADKARVMTYLCEKKQQQIDKVVGDLAKLTNEMSALTTQHPRN